MRRKPETPTAECEQARWDVCRSVGTYGRQVLMTSHTRTTASQWAVFPELNVDSDADAMRFDSEQEAMAWQESNPGKGWPEKPLPVISVRACAGGIFQGKRLQEWLPVENIPRPVEGDPVDEMMEFGFQELDGVSVWPACCLDTDWDFPTLETIAKSLQGHDHTNRTPLSAQAVVFGALADFEDAISSRHGVLTSSAIGWFWQSWEVHRHIKQFCERLEISVTARRLGVDSRDRADAMEPSGDESTQEQPATVAGAGAETAGPEPQSEAGPANGNPPSATAQVPVQSLSETEALVEQRVGELYKTQAKPFETLTNPEITRRYKKTYGLNTSKHGFRAKLNRIRQKRGFPSSKSLSSKKK